MGIYMVPGTMEVWCERCGFKEDKKSIRNKLRGPYIPSSIEIESRCCVCGAYIKTREKK